MTLVLVEGASYSFVLLAKTKAQAQRAMRKGWRKHLRQCHIDPVGADAIEDACTVNYIEDFKPDTLYRDYEAV